MDDSRNDTLVHNKALGLVDVDWKKELWAVDISRVLSTTHCLGNLTIETRIIIYDRE